MISRNGPDSCCGRGIHNADFLADSPTAEFLGASIMLKHDAKARARLAKEALEDAAKELAKINNETPMTKEQAEEISKRST